MEIEELNNILGDMPTKFEDKFNFVIHNDEDLLISRKDTIGSYTTVPIDQISRIEWDIVGMIWGKYSVVYMFSKTGNMSTAIRRKPEE